MTYCVLLPGMFTPPFGCIPRLAYYFHRADEVIADDYLGLGSLDKAYSRAKDRVAKAVRGHGPVHIKAHSLGGYFGGRLVVEEPQLVTGLSAVSAPYRGLGLFPHWMIGCAKPVTAVKELVYEDGHTGALRAQFVTGLDPTISVVLTSLAWDPIVPRRSALALTSSTGGITKYHLGPIAPRHLANDVKHLRSMFGIDHLGAILHGDVTSLRAA